MKITSRRKPRSSRFIDLTGQRFGRLVAEKFVGFAGDFSVWRCRCDCGKRSRVRANALRSGKTKSCGCRRGRPRAHALSGTPEYQAWRRIIGSGDPVCRRWREGVENFLEDMGERPRDGYRLKRVEKSKPWSASNCEWRPHEESGRARLIAFRGERLTLAGWGRRLGLTPERVGQRLKQYTVEEALTTPVGEMPPGHKRRARPGTGRPRQPERMLTHAGETLPLSEWAARLGMQAQSLKRRLKDWGSVEAALTTPKGEWPGRPIARAERIITHGGESLRVREWAARLGMQPSALLQRLEKWESVEKALTTPKLEWWQVAGETGGAP